MEVLFRFLNWVSSFHTVDEETGNKMDTWNIATVMAPNILRESNDKEMRTVDQGAVKVVFDLIENNDEFSEVQCPRLFRDFTDCLRYHQRLWSCSTMILLRTCPRKKSCDSGSRGERTQCLLLQPRHGTKVQRRLRRTSGTPRKLHPPTVTHNLMQTRLHFVT